MLHVYNCILLKIRTWGLKLVEENIILWINYNQCYCRGRSHILRNLSLGTPVTDPRLKCNAVLRISPLFSKLLILIPESNEDDKAVIIICHCYRLHSLIILKLQSFFSPLISRFFLCQDKDKLWEGFIYTWYIFFDIHQFKDGHQWEAREARGCWNDWS